MKEQKTTPVDYVYSDAEILEMLARIFRCESSTERGSRVG